MKVEFDVLKGKTIRRIDFVYSKISENDEMESLTELILYTLDNKKYRMFHEQDCCERVRLEDINGDLGDLLNVPLLMAEEVSSRETPKDVDFCSYMNVYLWTFYKFATIHGSVTLRWMSVSNGYYSEKVEIDESEV